MIETATLAGGCFWCTEAIFQRLRGVSKVTSGYSGGTTPKHTYEEVSNGTTGHAEAIQVEFDPSQITYEEILEVFFATHDPTTKDRQGADVGTQYRSAIFFHSDEQKQKALSAKEKAQANYSSPIVTEIVEFTGFSEAEEDHKNYYNQNPDKMYCKLVIGPKIQKLRHILGKDQKTPDYGA